MATLPEKALKRLVGMDPFPQPPVIRTRHPVVLMHGFGILAGLRRGGHLHEEAMNLRLHGVLAYAPNVASYNTVAVRAEMWKMRLEHVLSETGADRINLIAHSMGGLDARLLIAEHGFHAHVTVLATISTPHRGTALAVHMLNQPERLRRWGVELANWMGETALEDGTADAQKALVELCPDYMTETFNPAVPDHPDVQYWSYGGAAGKGTAVPVNPFLRFGNGVIFEHEGPNDGMVSVGSARWGTFLGTVEADHAQQIGLNTLTSHTFDANAFYLDIVRRMADAGF
ncbi:MAG: lipase [Rhodothermales bacterium]|nr:lipase [Rhodothermales bacterium]